jgi:hypothetical protein
MLIRPAPEPQGRLPRLSYVVYGLIGLFGGLVLSGVIGWPLYVVGGSEAAAGSVVVFGFAVTTSVVGGLWVARERRREDGPGRRAHAAVLTYVGWALLGAYVGLSISLVLALAVSVDSLSGQAQFLLVTPVLGGAASGLLVARKRQAV